MKNALVIGASRGIGLELVRQYRAEGIAVTATARDDAGLARLAELGAKALRLDVATAAAQLQAALKATLADPEGKLNTAHQKSATGQPVFWATPQQRENTITPAG